MFSFLKRPQAKITAEKLAELYNEIYHDDLSNNKQDIKKLILGSRLQYNIIYNAVKKYL